MKRSELNKIMIDTKKFLDEKNFILPPFAYWSPEEWAEKNHEYDEIRDNMIGWDITDFGSGDYEKCGLMLFTIRNGNVHDKKYTKTYGAGAGTVFVDAVEFDESAQSYQGQISISLTDPSSGVVVGAMTIGLNAEAFF